MLIGITYINNHYQDVVNIFLDCPDNTGEPVVFRWKENEKGDEIRIHVGRKL
jgi:hypothetical protein